MIYVLNTETLQGQSVTIKTNIGTLKQVWNILKEVKLDGLLTGGSLELNFNELIDNLISKGTLESFLSAITNGLTAPADSLDLVDVVGIINLFFTSIAQPFQGLKVAVTDQIIPRPQTEVTSSENLSDSESR